MGVGYLNRTTRNKRSTESRFEMTFSCDIEKGIKKIMPFLKKESIICSVISYHQIQ